MTILKYKKNQKILIKKTKVKEEVKKEIVEERKTVERAANDPRNK